MKNLIIACWLISATVIMFSSCNTSQRITHSYVNEKTINHEPYNNIAVLVLTSNEDVKEKIEKQMVAQIKKNKVNAIGSMQIIPNHLSSLKDVDKEKFAAYLKEANCDALVTVAVKDIKSEDKYINTGASEYMPGFSYIYYNDYQSYYQYRNAEMQNEGQFVQETTYYFESNLFDLTSKAMVWSVQTEAVEPSSLKSWFKGYSKIMVEELKEIGAIRK